MAVEFPQPQVVALEYLASQLIDKRKPGTDLGSLARDLLRGFHDVCSYAGIDHVLEELAEAHPGLDVSDRSSLEDHPEVLAALIGQLEAINLDGGGPRNAKAKQLVDCVIGALGLTPVEVASPKIQLSGEVRAEVAAAIAAVVDSALARLRDSIVEEARGKVVENHLPSFSKMVAQLDDRGQKLLKVPKVPLDAQHAIERAFAEARGVVIARIVGAALDRAKAVIERADPEAAKRIDAPIKTNVTPREVAARRAADARVPKTAAAVGGSVLESLAELARITFSAAEKPVHPYSASKTFAMGDVIEHPKFGRGTVVAVATQRIDVEFAGNKATLVHGR